MKPTTEHCFNGAIANIHGLSSFIPSSNPAASPAQAGLGCGDADKASPPCVRYNTSNGPFHPRLSTIHISRHLEEI
jgi:hypothetical protein